jgi:succinate dehydrogenase/fumarate reductase flavoprotein subunit
MIRDSEIISTDVLVIGGGGAASRCAIAADNEGVPGIPGGCILMIPVLVGA